MIDPQEPWIYMLIFFGWIFIAMMVWKALGWILAGARYLLKARYLAQASRVIQEERPDDPKADPEAALQTVDRVRQVFANLEADIPEELDAKLIIMEAMIRGRLKKRSPDPGDRSGN